MDVPLGERLCEMLFMVGERYSSSSRVILHVRSFVEEARAMSRLNHMISQYAGRYLVRILGTGAGTGMDDMVKKEILDMVISFVVDDCRK